MGFKILVFVWFVIVAYGIDRVREEIAELQTTQDQTVDFLSDLHAERAK